MAKDDDDTIRGIVFGLGDFSPKPDFMAAALVDFGPGFDEFFETSAQVAREIKEAITINGPEDIPILVTVITDTGSMELPVQQMCDQMDMRPPEVLAINLKISRQVVGMPIAVMCLMETVYVKLRDEHEEYERGALADRFYRGDRTVAEALVMTIATRDRYASEFMPFHYGDGSVVWDEGARTEIEGWPEVELHERIAEAIQIAFRQEGGPDGPE